MDAVDVAAFFKAKGKDRFQVMKLTSYTQGLYLKLYDEPLFEDQIEAWERGSRASQCSRHLSFS